MKPEAQDYLKKARRSLENAQKIIRADIPDVAAREAYLAAFHAAEAFIVERSGRAAKTHRGVRSQFSRLAKDEGHFDRELLAFLGEGYDLKSAADYGVGAGADDISEEDAARAIAAASRFIERVAAALS